MKKTKPMVSGPRLDLLRDSDAFPCAVCRSCYGVNSIECSKGKHLAHKKCSGADEDWLRIQTILDQDAVIRLDRLTIYLSQR